MDTGQEKTCQYILPHLGEKLPKGVFTMKNTIKLFGVIAIMAVIGFTMASCGGGAGDGTTGDLDLSGIIGISYSSPATAGEILSAYYSGSESVSYQWNKDGTALSGKTETTLIAETEGSYTVTVSAAGYKSKTSDAVIVGPAVPIWIAVEDTTFDANRIQAITYGNGKFVAGGYNGTMATSLDGINWTAVVDNKFGTTSYINAIAYGNSTFVAGGETYSFSKMATSPDGINWTAVATTTFDTAGIKAIAYGNGKFVAGGANGKMAYSTDNGTTWTAVPNSTFDTAGIFAIAYGNGNFVAGGSYGRMAISPDGINWGPVYNSSFHSGSFEYYVISAIAHANGKFFAGGREGGMSTSPDGINWTGVYTEFIDYSTYTFITAIAYGNGIFVAVGGHGQIVYLLDD